MSSSYNESEPTPTRFPSQDEPSREPGYNPGSEPLDPVGDPVVDPPDRPGYGSDPSGDPGILDDPRGEFASGPTAGGSAGFDDPLPEPGAGPVARGGYDSAVGESGGSVTGSEMLDDPYGRPGVPGERGQDPGVVIDPVDQYDEGVASGREPVAPMEPVGDDYGRSTAQSGPVGGYGGSEMDANQDALRTGTEVRANPGDPAYVDGDYRGTEVRANPGDPAYVDGDYGGSEVKANPGPPAPVTGDYDDQDQVKGNLGPQLDYESETDR